jgi:hypothetical protein
VNAAASVHDFHVCRSIQPYCKLIFAASGIDEMGMWINKAWSDRFSRCIYRFCFSDARLKLLEKLFICSDCDNRSVFNPDAAIKNRPFCNVVLVPSFYRIGRFFVHFF